jgi:hypothetical protein
MPCLLVIIRLETPAAAAEVAKPLRSECPAYRAGSRPAASTQRLTTRATLLTKGGEELMVDRLDERILKVMAKE